MTSKLGIVLALGVALFGQRADAALLRFDSGLYTTTYVQPVGGGGTPPVPYTTTMRAQGTFTIAGALTPDMANAGVVVTNYVLDDGVGVLTQTDTPVRNFFLTTDSAGVITGWNFELVGPIISDGVQRVVRADTAEPIFGFVVSQDRCDPGSGTDPATGIGFCSYLGPLSFSQFAYNDGSQMTLAPVAVDQKSLPPAAVLLVGALGALALRRSRATPEVVGPQPAP